MNFFLILLCFYIATATTLPTRATPHEEYAKQLLESHAYPQIKDEATALKFIDLLSEAFENYTQSEPVAIDFPCQRTGRSPSKPIDAKQLRPADVDILIALGDSLTAAFGAEATGLWNLFTDYRGSSFSGGGAKSLTDVSTLANILRFYNPNLQGYSIGPGNQNSANAKLNAAVTGATSYDLSAQVNMLVTNLEANYNVNGWKLLTLFIGGNDLCASCNEVERYSAVNFALNVENTLDQLKARISNLFVNLVLPPDVTLLSGLTGGLCGILHPFECSCNTDESTHILHMAYVDELIKLVAKAKYHDSVNFNLVIQPFLEYIHLPLGPDGKPDKSYFAPDCFHFSVKSHSAAGLSLWNNLMETDADKKREWVVGEPFECPGPDQFIR